MLTKLTVRKYAEKLASGEPTPGGGSAAALAGALAAALGEMVANFTVGKGKFAHVEEDVRAILQRLEAQRKRLLDLADADADAYARVGAAYGMPKNTDKQKQARARAIQKALIAAAEVPFTVTEACAGIIDELDALRQKGNPNLLSDVAVSAQFALAAMRCGCLNVDVNLALVKDQELVAAQREVMDRRLFAAETAARMVFDSIAGSLR